MAITLEWLQLLVTVLCAVIASGGFWAFMETHREKKDKGRALLIGLAHDRIIYLGMQYISRGHITQDEYENLVVYLYEPYEKYGGNGSAKRVIDEVKKLPIK